MKNNRDRLIISEDPSEKIHPDISVEEQMELLPLFKKLEFPRNKITLG